jgi:LysR family cys regulon transcriptional activator
VNLHQLEAVCHIARHRYSISAAADALGRSQPALSRQLKELEAELGTRIFVRTRNKLIGLTHQGEKILLLGQRILQDVRTVEQMGAEDSIEERSELRVATSHVHARYLLPDTIKAFIRRHPGVALTLQQCDPVQCRDIIAAGDADVGISTLSPKPSDPIVTIPAFRLPRCVIVPAGHPLAGARTFTLKQLAEYPLIANPVSFSGRSILEEAFARAGVQPRIVCSANDADVCKTYVGVGMGIAVLATLAFDPVMDRGLVCLDASHLFRPGVLNVAFRKHSYLTRPLDAFLSVFAPHLGRDLILKAMQGAEIDRARLSQRAPVAQGAKGPVRLDA